MDTNVFVTCLADTFYPQAARSVTNLLHKMKIKVSCPPGQTCCGQPMYNAGYFKDARKAAQSFIDLFGNTEGPIICPSASCAAMVKVHYPKLFKDDPVMAKKADVLSGRIYEFTEYLVKYAKINLADLNAEFNDSVTFHQSCHFRHLGVTDEPMNLIKQIKNINYIPLQRMDQCCGFGGTFSVNYPHISKKVVADKVKCIHESGASWLIYADAGCAMNILGYANKTDQPIKAMHIAELIDKATGDLSC
ncbi:MAG: (Fe-S)-binding protein [Phycisphaerae bacterium]|nr:(Fe-S)-binding protein [Phycisphaerae bacterium]